MKKKMLVSYCALLLVFGLFVGSVRADSKFAFGLTYVNGFSDIVDLYEYNLKKEGYLVYSSDYLPVGISFRTDTKMFNHFHIGFGIGPLMYISAKDYDFFNAPVNAHVKYVFNEEGSSAPYVIGGISHHFASGDFVEDSGSGMLAGIGFELFRDKRVNMGILAAYDGAEIDFKKHQTSVSPYNDKIETIKPAEFTLSVMVIF